MLNKYLNITVDGQMYFVYCKRACLFAFTKAFTTLVQPPSLPSRPYKMCTSQSEGGFR